MNVHIRVRDPVGRAHAIRDQDLANQHVQVGLGLERVVETRGRVVAEVHEGCTDVFVDACVREQLPEGGLASDWTGHHRETRSTVSESTSDSRKI